MHSGWNKCYWYSHHENASCTRIPQHIMLLQYFRLYTSCMGHQFWQYRLHWQFPRIYPRFLPHSSRRLRKESHYEPCTGKHSFQLLSSLNSMRCRDWLHLFLEVLLHFSCSYASLMRFQECNQYWQDLLLGCHHHCCKKLL